jgi:hypothetical protein
MPTDFDILIEAIDILEAENPGVFGPNGGYSRALSITNMTWMAGLMTGPLLAQLIIGQFDYFELQCCLGKTYLSVSLSMC